MDSNSFNKNVEWNIEQIGLQVLHAKKVNGRARSGYYKAAIVLAASVVEALAFKLLEMNKEQEMPLNDWKCLNSCFLPEKLKSANGNRLSICERKQEKFCLTKHTDFKEVNEVCKKIKIFSDQFFNKIETVRRLRNKIHIQGLENIDRSYTNKDLEFVSSVMDEFLVKIKA